MVDSRIRMLFYITNNFVVIVKFSWNCMDRFSNFFHQVIRRKILYVDTHKDFHLTCNMLLHYIVTKIQKK